MGIVKEKPTGNRDNMKKEILDAASQFFRLKGFNGTSMQDIASAVGMLKASQHPFWVFL